ncbi:MAG: NifB/NifX family molybdenum-iron cluster-binding protein [Kiritimatiellae bacterium]|jgi:predicted Fe-Mo cluster-binding NifX family protein|nr:NifB/NifX family molybdenum-iron cluster-binding protein [Kiritimatiellia bacterium]
MKTAISSWNGRIAPVFDVSRQIAVLETNGARVISRQTDNLETDEPFAKINQLMELGIDALICGAVSRPLADMITARGIKLIPFVAGEIEQVEGAYLTGNLGNAAFAMPGCCGRRQRFRGAGGGRGRGACFGGRRRAFM